MDEFLLYSGDNPETGWDPTGEYVVLCPSDQNSCKNSILHTANDLKSYFVLEYPSTPFKSTAILTITSTGIFAAAGYLIGSPLIAGTVSAFFGYSESQKPLASLEDNGLRIEVMLKTAASLIFNDNSTSTAFSVCSKGDWSCIECVAMGTKLYSVFAANVGFKIGMNEVESIIASLLKTIVKTGITTVAYCNCS
jgi:hypothetical protein